MRRLFKKEKNSANKFRDDDVLVHGYIRIEYDKKYKLNTPSEIKNLCYKYWKPQDEWYSDYILKSRILLNTPYRISVTTWAMTTIFGTNIVKKGTTYFWRIKLLHLKKQTNSENRRAWTQCPQIGIIPNNEDKMSLFKYTIEWQDKDFICYWFDVAKGKVYSNKFGLPRGLTNHQQEYTKPLKSTR